MANQTLPVKSPSRTTIAATRVNRRVPDRWHTRLFLAALIALVLLLFVALRARPDALHGAAYLRAFVARSAVFALLGAALGALISLVRRTRRKRFGALAGAVLAVLFQIGLTLWLAWRYDRVLIESARRVEE